VAAFDDNEDTVTMLREWFAAGGIRCVTAPVRDFAEGRDLAQFLGEERPDVIVVDAGLSFGPTRHCLQVLRALPEFAHVPVILTTTMREALDRLPDAADTFAIIDKPYDLDALTLAVRRAAGEG
jgi:CheY-like chemotaxis protein